MEPRLALLRLSDLRAHEEILPGNLARVLGSIVDTGRLYKPIIVDEKTHVIIDGHHRYAALRILGARRVPALLASYDHHIAGIAPKTVTIKVRTDSQDEALAIGSSTIEAVAGQGRFGARLALNDIIVTLRVNPLEIYRALPKLAKTVIGRSGRPYNLSLTVEPLEPSHVRGLPCEEILLPPKSTIHLTPLKNMVINYKLSKLL